MPITLEYRRRKARHAVQTHYVAAREVRSNVLCLASPSGSQKREYRAILEVSGVNYHLKSEEEQLLINDQFQLFLAGLNHPLQIMIRVLPLNLEPYLKRFQVSALDGNVLSTLAQGMVQFLSGLASGRTLLERRFYIIIPATPVTERSSLLIGLSGAAPRATASGLNRVFFRHFPPVG